MAMMASEVGPAAPSELVRIAAILQQERGMPTALERALYEARRLTSAEAGTVFLLDGDLLRFTVVQNDVLRDRIGERRMRACLQLLPLPVTRKSLAGYVAITAKSVNVADVARLPRDCPYLFDRTFDVRGDYRTRAVLTVPIRDRETTLGVLQLINPRDLRGRAAPFERAHESILRWFAAQMARVIPDLRTRVADLAVSAAEVTDPSEAAAPAGPAAVVESDGATEDDLALLPAWNASTTADIRSELAADRSGRVGRRLGDLLLSEQLITAEQLADALAEQKRTQQRLGAILVGLDFISEAKLMETLARQYRIPLVDLDTCVVDPELVRLVPGDLVRRFTVMPVERRNGTLTVAVADPTDLSALDQVAFTTGLAIVPVLAPLSALHQKIDQVYDAPASLAASLLDQLQDEADVEVVSDEEPVPVLDARELRTSADETPVVRLVNAILLDAVKRGASDIHFESFARRCRVRFRIDGVLQSVMAPAKRLEPAIVSRIKIMADLDIAEHRLPQDGRAKLRMNGREIDLRVSVIPTVFGESVDIRVLDGSRIKPDLRQLGLNGPALDHVLATVRDPNGVVLITGPTGSGKTTTLYSIVHRLNERDLKILTIEDPVEYLVDGVNQVHVNEAIGRTFASTLRSFLRHDPDVVLVGEMRDQETAEVAVRAGLTGHLVLSTVHTNDCPSTIVRLVDMGVAPFLIAASLRFVVAQRLLRRLCADCRSPYPMDGTTLAQYGLTASEPGPVTLYRPSGCPACGHTGFSGRIGVFEVMGLTPELRDLIGRGASLDALRAAARHGGMTTLREAALARLLEGQTTLEEVLRTTSLEDDAARQPA